MKKGKVQNEKSVEKTIIDGDLDETVSGWGYRHQQCLILFFCLTTAYSIRACMGVALVDMTHNYNVVDKLVNSLNVTNSVNATDDFEEEHGGFLYSLMLVPPYPKFKWNKKIQDVILAAFSMGYMVLQIPAGHLANKYGAKQLLIGSMSVNAVISIGLPWAAYYGGWISTVMCRIVLGLSQACLMPGMHTFFGKWAPLQERGRLTAVTYGGQALGPVLGLPITGFIASSDMGWPGIFRFYGCLSGFVAFLIWWYLAETPAEHSKISAAERWHITEGLGLKKDSEKKHMTVPWSKILRCRGLYAIVIGHIGNSWGQLTLYSEVPSFMDKVMGVNIKANGLLSALPFFVMWMTNFFFSWLTDMLIVKNILTVTNTRKFAHALGSIPAALGLIALAYVPKDIYFVESLLVLICAFKISAHSGFLVNHIDITPNFAGTMMSISNFVSNMVASLAPLVAGFILYDDTSEYLWRKVFFIAAGFYAVTTIIYVALGTAEKADWNEPHEENTKESEAMLPKPVGHTVLVDVKYRN